MGDIVPINGDMEQLIAEIEVAAAVRGMNPRALLKKSISASWSTWDSWLAGKSSPTMASVDRIRAWMADNPATSDDEAVA